MKKDNKGFSLVELIVVVAIMAVLMTVLAPQLLGYVEKSRAQKDASAGEELRHAVEIAISNEDVYKELGISATQTTATVTYADATDRAYSITGKGTKLLAELDATFGAKQFDFTSATYDTKSYVITITYDNTTKAVTVSGAFN